MGAAVSGRRHGGVAGSEFDAAPVSPADIGGHYRGDSGPALPGGVPARPGGVLGGGLPAYNLYPTRSGWLAVAALEPHFLQRLAAELGLEKVTAAALRARFAERTAVEWEEWALVRDLPMAAVETFER